MADAIDLLTRELEEKKKELTRIDGKLKDLKSSVEKLEKVRREIGDLKNQVTKLEGTERSYLTDESNFKRFEEDKRRIETEIHTMSSRLDNLAEKAKEGQK